jgi:hypothetical protein
MEIIYFFLKKEKILINLKYIFLNILLNIYNPINYFI